MATRNIFVVLKELSAGIKQLSAGIEELQSALAPLAAPVASAPARADAARSGKKRRKVSAGAKPQKAAPQPKTKPKKSKVEGWRKNAGLYGGLIRHLPKDQQAQVRKVRDEKGIEAAIAFGNGLKKQ